jgi:TonB family protein
MSRRRLAVSFVVMAALLALVGHTVVRALPLHAGTLALQQTGAARPGQMTSAPAGPGKKGLVPTTYSRILFPAGSPEVPVIVSVVVGPGGTVSSVTPVQGPAELAAVAVEGVKSWRFAAPGRTTTFLVGFNPAAGGTDLAAQAPASIGPGVTPPAKTKDVKPVYPAEAQKARVQGIVIVGVHIAADGSVSDAQVLRSVPGLDEAALAAILGWRFDAKGFPVRMTVTVNFQLSDGPKKSGAGVGGGVAGGVAGGVEGGVAGGVGDDAALIDGERAGRVGGSVKPPQKTLDVKPVYPKEAQEAKVEGLVMIDVLIGGDGKVKRTKIVRSIPELDQAALDAVSQWQFTPTVVDGKPVAVHMTVTVNFTLQ